MGQIKFIAGIMLFGLFSIAVVSYAIGFANDNDAAISLEDDLDMSSLDTTLKSKFGDMSVNINESSTSFAQSDIDLGLETTKTGGFLKSLLSTTITPITTTFSVINNKIFGGKGSEFGVILTALTTFLVIVGGLYVWKSWKGGMPD